MKYAFTIYGDESRRASASEEEQQAMAQAYGAVTQEMQEKGVMVAGEGLYPTQTATTVRVRDSEREVTDGPFAETKEHLGGFAVVDVPDDAAARYWAGRIAVAVGWPQEVHRFPHRLQVGVGAHSDASVGELS